MLAQAPRGFVMVPAVGLLSTLLHEASARRPAEVVIETDQPVRMQLPDGTLTELAGSILGTAISDELSDLLTTEQQVDLALGERVKFDLVVGPYTWQLVGETAEQVISVRARPTGELYDASDSVQIPIEPDEVDPQDIPRIRRTASSGPSEIDIDINFDDDAAAQQEEPRPPAGLRLAALKPVPADSKPMPAWPRQPAAAPGKPAATPGKPVAAPGKPAAAPGKHLAPASKPVAAAVKPAPGPGKLGGPTWTRDARRARGQPVGAAANQQLPLSPGPSREDLAEILGAFGPGTLAFLLRAPGQGEVLVAALDLPVLVLGDSDTPEQATARIGELGPIGVLLLRAEDPAPWLPWLLRRVEEGHRVLVETDARTPAGARRILLGVGASPRAELWLDAVRVLTASVEDGRWTLLSPGT